MSEINEKTKLTEHGSDRATACCSPLLIVQERPLLVSGLITRMKKCGTPVIMIAAEQSKEEKIKALWHEVIHMIRMAGDYSQDEIDVEKSAVKLAKYCPEILDWVGMS